MTNAELVRSFLRAQNLEQVGRLDEAVAIYESIVAARFDSAGPYDRLLAIYGSQARHADVVRVTTEALEHVRTHASKRELYERTRDRARRSLGDVPRAAPRRGP